MIIGRMYIKLLMEILDSTSKRKIFSFILDASSCLETSI